MQASHWMQLGLNSLLDGRYSDLTINVITKLFELAHFSCKANTLFLDVFEPAHFSD